jgi:tetratricopeptide (TPR) repeat protein
MTAPAAMTEHLTDNELAALVEHGPKGVDRSVVEHVADCGECREALTMASDVKQQMEAEHNVEHGEFGRGRGAWKVFASAAALAAALFVVFGGPLRERWFEPHGVDALVKTARTMRFRPTEGRLSGDFPYKEHSRKRGPKPEDESFEEVTVAYETAKVQSDPKASAHAVGVAYLIRKNKRSEAISSLEKALASATPEKRPAIANDLAVALIERGSTEDLIQVLALLEKQKVTPQVAWNRALALDHLGRSAEAKLAWEEYLKLDPDSEWANEVKTKYLPFLELNPELRSP